ncbi:MAG TPA: ankyrin repeat domain-containing protein [Terracidiphilus sp.]|jgi:ankyrin repeat protein
MPSFNQILGAVYRKDHALLNHLTKAEVNLSDGDGRNPLMHAILADGADPSVIRLLLELGTDVQAADRGQLWTALHFASRDGNLEIVRTLLDAGAEIDPVNIFGNTPLFENIRGQKTNAAVIEELLRHGANPRKANNNGISPLGLARTIGRQDLVSLLEGNGTSRM